MFDIFFMVSLFFFTILCFFEAIIFNEEVLLALCFFSFLFFTFNAFNDSVFDIFQSRAAKFEADLLVSFNLTKQSITQLFSNFFSSRNFSLKFRIISLTVSAYINQFVKYSSFQLSSFFYSTSMAKLLELIAFENKLITTLQKKSVSLLLYPLIFQSAKSDISILTGLGFTTVDNFKSKLSILKRIS